MEIGQILMLGFGILALVVLLVATVVGAVVVITSNQGKSIDKILPEMAKAQSEIALGFMNSRLAMDLAEGTVNSIPAKFIDLNTILRSGSAGLEALQKISTDTQVQDYARVASILYKMLEDDLPNTRDQARKYWLEKYPSVPFPDQLTLGEKAVG